MNGTRGFYGILKRELRRLISRPLYLFCMVVAPIACCLFFTSLMKSGLPENLPVGVVDLDNTKTTREILRNLDAFSQTGIKQNYVSVSDAREAMQRGEIYAFYYIPESTTAQLIAGRQPKVSFYTNGSYLIAGSLTYRDMRTMSVLANASVGLQTMQAKGINEQTARELLQPIVIDTHPLNNPWLNYSVYLNNTILPGILMLLIFMITAFSIGIEFKDGTVKEWLALADGRAWIAVLGKLLPHTVIFFIVGIAYDTWLYGVLHFPCHSGILPLLLATFLMVVASQAVGVTFFTLLPTLRLSLSACSLWGMLSFSISGFTYPVMAMHPMLQSISNLFPLRHYFLIYVNQMLNGYQMSEVWTAYAALCAFILLPVLLYKRLKNALINFDYIP